MSYFEGVKTGDRVWSFEFGWGSIEENDNIETNSIRVRFDNGEMRLYGFDGKVKCFGNKVKQTLFWNEIKFEIPKRPRVELKENKYYIDLAYNKTFYNNDYEYGYALRCLFRNDKETAEKALKQIKKFTRLLALRDQECPDSRGYEFDDDKNNYIITKDINKYLTLCVYDYQPDKIYFKTREDAQKICDILNSNRFDLEG